MTKAIIVSDSHGFENELLEIKKRHQEDVDVFIHCGDSELGFDTEYMGEFRKVRGNCDFDTQYPNELDFEFDGVKFFVTHGHLFRVKSTLMPLSYRAQELGAKVICFGHSHLAGAEKIEDQLFINPGSIRLPRGRKEKTYVLMEWDDCNKIKVQFIELDGTPIPNMSFEFLF